MHLIEDSHDYRHKDMTEETLLTAIDMYCGLPDPFMSEKTNPLGCLMRAGAAQFDYDRELRHTIPRILVIYNQVWKQAIQEKDLDISDALQEMTGLTLQEILALGFTFFSSAHHGYIQIIENTEQYPEPLRTILSTKKQNSFLKWISCDYRAFRSIAKTDMPPSDKYEHFRFNPLYEKPALTPYRSPKPEMAQVYITPIPTLISYRITNGLYFALSNYFRKSTGGQSFRNAFGVVFQEYVGLLLRQSLGDENVIEEWNYVHKKDEKATPDWIVICKGRAVLIEAKQAGLYLESKKWANDQEIEKDLKRNIGKGAIQMYKFQNDVKDNICKLPKALDNIEITEKIVVTFDRSYYLNSILRDEIKRIYKPKLDDYHWHTIAVEELEYLLGYAETNFANVLEQKRCNPEYDKMDFKEYGWQLSQLSNREGTLHNPYLDSTFQQFFDDLGLENIGEKISGL